MTNYEFDHRLAKAIMIGIQLVLTLSLVYVFVNHDIWYVVLLLIMKEMFYFYGVNTVGYFLEWILGHKHKHPKV